MDKERDWPTGENHGDTSMGGDGQGSGNQERLPKDTNEANQKGAQNEGKDGTKPTASQQQGQGAENAKNSDSRSGSDSGGGSGSSGGQSGQSQSGGNSKGSGGGGGTSAGAGQSS